MSKHIEIGPFVIRRTSIVSSCPAQRLKNRSCCKRGDEPGVGEKYDAVCDGLAPAVPLLLPLACSECSISPSEGTLADSSIEFVVVSGSGLSDARSAAFGGWGGIVFIEESLAWSAVPACVWACFGPLILE